LSEIPEDQIQDWVLYYHRGQGVPALAIETALRLTEAIINNQMQLIGNPSLVINRERSPSGTTDLVAVSSEPSRAIRLNGNF